MPNNVTSWLFRNGNFPCKNCKERYDNCHTYCEEYMNAKNNYEEYKQKHRYDEVYFKTEGKGRYRW